jgi:hypothetical protein
MLNATKYSLICLWERGLTKDSNTGKCLPTVVYMGSWKYNLGTDQNLVRYVSFTTIIRNLFLNVVILNFLITLDTPKSRQHLGIL